MERLIPKSTGGSEGEQLNVLHREEDRTLDTKNTGTDKQLQTCSEGICREEALGGGRRTASHSRFLLSKRERPFSIGISPAYSGMVAGSAHPEGPRP